MSCPIPIRILQKFFSIAWKDVFSQNFRTIYKTKYHYLIQHHFNLNKFISIQSIPKFYLPVNSMSLASDSHKKNIKRKKKKKVLKHTFDSFLGCSLVKRCVTISQCVRRLPNNPFLPLVAIFKCPVIWSSIKKNSVEFDEKTFYAISSRIQKAWSYCGTCRFQSSYYLHQKEIIGRCQGKDLKNIFTFQ